ncbi:MAG: NFACT RNA binding domain-containing protein [Myxococcales bacterium]
MNASLGKVARVDQPMPGLLSLSLRSAGSTHTLILVTLPGALGAGLVDQRPKGASATPAISQLRHHLEGAMVEAVETSRRVVRVSLLRIDRRVRLWVTTHKPNGAWWLSADDGSILVRSPGAPPNPPPEDSHLQLQSAGGLRASAPEALDAHRLAYERQLRRVLDRQIKRLARKRDAVRADLERAAAAEDLQEKASLLLAHAYQIENGARHLDATTWDDPPRVVRIELDPRKSPAELAQDLFAKSKRLKRGLELAPKRLQTAEAELVELHDLRRALEQGAQEHVVAELEARGIRTTAPKERARKQRRAGARLPYREFATAEGSPVLVGRGAADNDRLTLRVAKPHDLWLHARGVSGAHVVVPLLKGKPCAAETLVDAATLAAHFSDLRGEQVVDVLYTPRRFVRKRKGSPPGAVTLEQEKVMAVRVERDRLARLLESEKRAY